MGDGPEVQANAERSRRGWANMLQQLDKVLTARTWGFKAPGSA